MRLLPSERKERIESAIAQFEADGRLCIMEPCDCSPGRIMHNNGGNYHQVIHLARDENQVFIKEDTTCDLVPEAEWWPTDEAPRAIIERYGDWL